MKKILLIIAIAFCIFQMVVLAIDIDIGSAAIDRSSNIGPNATYILLDNPANASGKITSIEIYAQTDLVSCDVGIFFNVSGNNYSTRDSEALGAVTGGSKQVFGADLDVTQGDYLGVYFTAGGDLIEFDPTGSNGIYYKAGDYIPCTDEAFSLFSGTATISLYGTGATVEVEANVILFGTNF